MTTSKAGPLISASYCVGTLLIVISALDYAGTVLPADFGDPGWRYGAVGLLSGFTLTPLLGGLLLSLAAAHGGEGRFLRVLGVLHIVGAAALLVLIAGFSLDSLQARKDASPEIQNVTEISTLKALIKLVATVVAVAWIGIAGIRQARRTAEPAAGNAGLVIGR